MKKEKKRGGAFKGRARGGIGGKKSPAYPNTKARHKKTQTEEKKRPSRQNSRDAREGEKKKQRRS